MKKCTNLSIVSCTLITVFNHSPYYIAGRVLRPHLLKTDVRLTTFYYFFTLVDFSKTAVRKLARPLFAKQLLNTLRSSYTGFHSKITKIIRMPFFDDFLTKTTAKLQFLKLTQQWLVISFDLTVVFCIISQPF